MVNSIYKYLCFGTAALICTALGYLGAFADINHKRSRQYVGHAFIWHDKKLPGGWPTLNGGSYFHIITDPENTEAEAEKTLNGLLEALDGLCDSTTRIGIAVEQGARHESIFEN